MSLVIVGSIGLDNVETPHGKVSEVLGGAAMYSSMSSKHFDKTYFVGVVGEDFPAEHIQMLRDNGIETDGLEIVKGKTFRWSGVYNDLNCAETLDTQLNVFADFNPQMSSQYSQIPYLFLANIHPSLQLQVFNQMDKPRMVGLDTMNFWIDGARADLDKIVSKVDIFFINEDEIKSFAHEENIFVAAQKVLAMGPRLLVIKRGEYGAMAIGKDFLFFSPIYPLKTVVDPTGAGDCFAGGFMGYLSQQDNFEEETIKQAMIYGTVMSSLNIEGFSLDSLKKARREDIEARKAAIKKSVVFD